MGDQKLKTFQNYMIYFFKNSGRIFPWRYSRDPYKVLVSEIMLQRTRAKHVVDPFIKLILKYKTIDELANADPEYIHAVFKRLGLMNRAELLLNIAREISDKYSGKIPKSREKLLALKGIGDYTCNAILCFGFNKPYAIVDSNVVRLFERYFGIKPPSKIPNRYKNIWDFADEILPNKDYVEYNYGLLDFAAMVCKAGTPKCDSCEIRNYCIYKVNEMEIRQNT